MPCWLRIVVVPLRTCYYSLAGYNMLVLLVEFVRQIGMSNIFVWLDELDGLELSASLTILLVYPP